MSDRIKWHPSYEGGIEFSARLADHPHDAWARLALVDGEWWWRLFWNRRFNKWEKCGADRQEASDAANAALVELLATTEIPAPLPMGAATDYRGNGGPKFSPQGIHFDAAPQSVQERRSYAGRARRSRP